MKIKPGFKTKDVCGEHVLIGMGEANINFTKIINFNEVSHFIWQQIEKGADTLDEIVKAITDEYDVDDATARKDSQALIDQLVELGVLEK